MADSTASGPLWQQRPYPAPGTIMRSKETSSEPAVGPSSRGPSHSSQPPSSSSRAGSTNHRAPFVKGFAPNKGHNTARSAPGHYGPSR
jgi:hypothetical protein